MIRAVSDTPCWTLDHEHDSEWVRHYPTEHEANKSLWDQRKEAREDLSEGATMADERPDLVTSTAMAETAPCLELICDGCGLADGLEEMVDPGNGAHYDSVDDLTLSDEFWTRVGDQHFCRDCPVPREAEDDGRTPGPDDVPLIGLDDAGKLQDVAP